MARGCDGKNLWQKTNQEVNMLVCISQAAAPLIFGILSLQGPIPSSGGICGYINVFRYLAR